MQIYSKSSLHIHKKHLWKLSDKTGHSEKLWFYRGFHTGHVYCSPSATGSTWSGFTLTLIWCICVHLTSSQTCTSHFISLVLLCSAEWRTLWFTAGASHEGVFLLLENRFFWGDRGLFAALTALCKMTPALSLSLVSKVNHHHRHPLVCALLN